MGDKLHFRLPNILFRKCSYQAGFNNTSGASGFASSPIDELFSACDAGNSCFLQLSTKIKSGRRKKFHSGVLQSLLDKSGSQSCDTDSRRPYLGQYLEFSVLTGFVGGEEPLEQVCKRATIYTKLCLECQPTPRTSTVLRSPVSHQTEVRVLT